MLMKVGKSLNMLLEADRRNLGKKAQYSVWELTSSEKDRNYRGTKIEGEWKKFHERTSWNAKKKKKKWVDVHMEFQTAFLISGIIYSFF